MGSFRGLGVSPAAGRAMDLTWHWRGLVGGVCAVMLAAFLAPLAARAPEVGENRRLAAAPDWPTSLAGFATARAAADRYVSDRFPARPFLIAGLNLARMTTGTSGSPKVLVGRDGWLFYDDGSHLGAARGEPAMALADTQAWLGGLAGRTEALAARGVPYLVIVPPVKESVRADQAPPWFEGANPNRAAIRLPTLAQAAGAGRVIYLHDAVAAQGARAFSRHDTHWTGLGAYGGYRATMTELARLGVGRGPRPLSAFAPETLTGRSRPRDLAKMLGVSSFVTLDYPSYVDPVAERSLRTTHLTDRTDWTAPQVIDTGQAGKPVALITRDSFSNAVLPFLYRDFSRLILTHVQDGAWRPDLIDRFQPDVVILEVLEANLPGALLPAPTASSTAQARIERALR